MPGAKSKLNPYLILSTFGDFILMLLLFVVDFIFWTRNDPFQDQYLLLYLYLMILWIVFSFLFGCYDVKHLQTFRSIFTTVTKLIVFFFFGFLIFFQFKSLSYFPREWIKYQFPLLFAAIISWKVFIRYSSILPKLFIHYTSRILVVSTKRGFENIHNNLRGNFFVHHFKVEQWIDPIVYENQSFAEIQSDIEHIIEDKQIDEVFLETASLSDPSKKALTSYLNHIPTKIHIIPDVASFQHRSIEFSKIGTTYLMTLHEGPLSYWYNRLQKSVIDKLLALVVVFGLLIWLIPIITIIYWFIDRKGPFFTQSRTSINGKVYTIIKFRSMFQNEHADTQQAVSNDHRITPFGRLLRKTNLDELPQFWNVLKGEMSIVGPRPHMLYHTDLYKQVTDQFMLRHSVLPGITGLAQIHGYRGEVKCQEDIIKRVEKDIEYINNWSFGLDFYIMFSTMALLLGLSSHHVSKN
jgi:putative colanic acid biosynthesis UDP-glucose lipid carrier transferase